MKKIITILFIVMLMITIFQIRNTLALYRAEFAGELSSTLGVWSVIVNDTDISSGNANMTFEITDEYFYYEDSANTSGTGIVPGGNAYFDIIIDALKADVSVRYNLKLSDVTHIKIDEETVELENPIEIKLVGIEDIFEKDEEIETDTEHTNIFDSDNNLASGVIPLSVMKEGYKGRVRVCFNWVNNEANNEIDTLLANPELGVKLGFTTGNNEVDTMLIESDERVKISIPVELEVVQYMGEELLLEVPVATP